MTPSKTLDAIRHPPLVLACVLAAFGCGERSYVLDPGHIDPDATSEAPLCLDGAQAELTRFSTQCAKSSRRSLSTEIRDGHEFPAALVAILESPCANGPTPSIEVFIEGNELVFDFAEVEEADRFPTAEFDGYIIDVVLTDQNARLVGALVDREHTTIEVDGRDLSIEPDRIEVNFEGVSYEPGSMLEIDLLFVDASGS